MGETEAPRANKVRRAKACNTCRRKKTKCDGKQPICSPCHTFNFSCTFQNVLKAPNRSSRAYVAELERRVQNMEKQLQQEEPSRREPQMSSRSELHGSAHSSPITRDGSESGESGNVGYQNSHHESVEFAKDDNCDGSDGEAVGIDQALYQDGKVRFFGASSGISIASLLGVNMAASQTGTAALRTASQKSASRWQSTTWVPRALQDSFERRTSQPLPLKNLAVELVREFFATFNKALPLFNETLFMRLLERQFSWNPEESPSWWASLNIVLAFTYRERAQGSSVGSEDWERSLGHVKNALNVVVELFMRHADLMAVQGLLGLAIYFQGTPNHQSLFMFAAAAMRLAQSIGLHRSNIHGLSASEVEDRTRTYWIAFILDADISLRVGRPPVQDTNDYDTPLPAEHPQDGKGIFSLDGTQIHYFRLLAQFALIQRRVYRYLYAVAVHRQARDVIVKEVKACEEALLRWKSSIPTKLQPQQAFSAKPNYFLQHILRLHCIYHCCYSNLHQVCMLTRPAAGSISVQGLLTVEKEIAQTVVGSLEAARSAVRLIKHFRSLGSSYQWHVLYFPAAASVALALGILVHPGHARAEADLCLIHETTGFLTRISSQEAGTYADHVLDFCSELENAARQNLGRTRQGHPKQPVGGAYSHGHEIYANENRDRHFESDADPTTTTMSSDGVLAACLQDTGHTSSPVGATAQAGNLPTIDPTSDLMMNWQWSVAPSWNWEDIMTSMPSSSFLDVPSQFPEDVTVKF